MLIQKMNLQECREFLGRVGMGRLGCSRENQPYVIPIYFAYEGDRLYGFATLGQKIEWMRSNPLVCVEADEVFANNNWRSVVVVGRFEELTDKPESDEDRRQAQDTLEKRAMWWQTAYASSQPRRTPKPALPIFYCIHIDDLSGNKALPDTVEAPFAQKLRRPVRPVVVTPIDHRNVEV